MTQHAIEDLFADLVAAYEAVGFDLSNWVYPPRPASEVKTHLGPRARPVLMAWYACHAGQRPATYDSPSFFASRMRLIAVREAARIRARMQEHIADFDYVEEGPREYWPLTSEHSRFAVLALEPVSGLILDWSVDYRWSVFARSLRDMLRAARIYVMAHRLNIDSGPPYQWSHTSMREVLEQNHLLPKPTSRIGPVRIQSCWA